MDMQTDRHAIDIQIGRQINKKVIQMDRQIDKKYRQQDRQKNKQKDICTHTNTHLLIS